jgi:CheY-like chemotaxis protein
MKKVLIIEDNLELRENTAEILELSGYEVVSAENGKVGVQRAFAENPDIIICDIMMPILDGYSTRQMLMDNDSTKDIPFIFLTAKADKSDFRKGMNLGADDYLTKPFDEIDLLNSIKLRLQKAANAKGNSGVQSFSKESLQDFVTKFIEDKKSIHYEKKDIIYREGDYASFAFYIVSGKVKTFKINEDGKELIFDLFKDGDVIGMWDVMKGTEYYDSVACLEDSEVIKIHRDDMQHFLESNSVETASLIQLFASELKEREDRLISMAYDTVRMRVASALVILEDVYHKKSGNTVFKIQREDLAAMVGTSAESVIRTLSDFKKEGLINIEKNEIYIKNSEGLRHFKF